MAKGMTVVEELLSRIPDWVFVLALLVVAAVYVKERAENRRIRSKKFVDRHERTTLATTILPSLRGPNAESILRENALSPSREYMEWLRLPSTDRLILDQRHVDRIRTLQQAERRFNPIRTKDHNLWLLKDWSVIGENEEGAFYVGDTSHERVAKEDFMNSMENRQGDLID